MYLRGRSALVTAGLAVLTLALCLPAGRAQAQRSSISAEHLLFVGAVGTADPAEIFGEDDLAFLLACREPITLSEVLARGIPFRASRIQQLQSWGLLVQRRQNFQITFPVWPGGAARPVHDVLDRLAQTLANALAGNFRAIQARVTELGYPEATPALVSWILRERAWNQLQTAAIIDVPGLVQRQREAYPDRGWWGALWYDELGPGAVHQIVTQTANNRTALVTWRSDAPPAPLDTEEPYTWLGPLVGAIRNDELEIRSADRFEEEAEAGMLDEEGHLQAPLVKWDPDDEEGFALLIEETVDLAVLTVAAQLSGEWAPPEIAALDPVVASTIAYTGLIPRVLRALEAQGVRSLIDPESSLTVSRRVANEDGDTSVVQRPGRLSVFFWKELPRESRNFPLPY